MDEAYLTSNELLQEIQVVLFLEDGEELGTATPTQDVHAISRDPLAYDGPLHVMWTTMAQPSQKQEWTTGALPQP